MINAMARQRQPPLWERDAPLTLERGAEIRRMARVVWFTGTAVFWACCVGAAIASHTVVVTVVVAVLAVLGGCQAWLGLRVVRNGIRANTPPQSNRPKIGL